MDEAVATVENLPLTHELQVVAPVPSEYRPGPQFWQTDAPVTFE